MAQSSGVSHLLKVSEVRGGMADSSKFLSPDDSPVAAVDETRAVMRRASKLVKLDSIIMFVLFVNNMQYY